MQAVGSSVSHSVELVLKGSRMRNKKAISLVLMYTFMQC